MKRVVVLIDPVHEYGVAFIQTVYRGWGVQTVCLYTNWRSVYLNAHRYPELQSKVMVAGHIMLKDQPVAQIARILRRDFEVVAVIPHVELSVGFACELAGELGLSWAQPEVLGRFRDKHALKRHIEAQPDAPRLNQVALVSSTEDVRKVLAGAEFDKFVLKPNDGYGNSSIGFFEQSSGESELADYFAATGRRKVLMEEFIAGPEYWVNGQVDGVGDITVHQVCLSKRIPINGRQNVDDEAVVIHRHEATFGQLEEYITSVVAASGLRRSPFHAEVIIDDRGPCLVEIAARLAGGDIITTMNILHGGRANFFQLAAHYYMSADAFGDVNLSWEHYDEACFTSVCGATSQRGLVWRIEGVKEIEALPEFVRWIVKPALGQALAPTTDVFGITWVVDLRASSEDQLRSAVAAVRRLLVFNEGQLAVVGIETRVKARMILAGKAARALPKVALVRPRPLGGRRRKVRSLAKLSDRPRDAGQSVLLERTSTDARPSRTGSRAT